MIFLERRRPFFQPVCTPSRGKLEDGFTLFAIEAIFGSKLILVDRGCETGKIDRATISIRYRYKIVDLLESFEMSIRHSEV